MQRELLDYVANERYNLFELFNYFSNHKNIF